MAKKKGGANVPGTSTDKRPTQAKIELPPDELEEVREVARSLSLPLAAFIRMAVKNEIKRVKGDAK